MTLTTQEGADTVGGFSAGKVMTLTAQVLTAQPLTAEDLTSQLSTKTPIKSTTKNTTPVELSTEMVFF